MYEIITKKRDGKRLEKDELQSLIDGYVEGSIPDYQISALLMAIFLNGMDKQETTELTGIMLRSGDTIELDRIKGVKVDKHSTGGVGDKVSFIVSPIVAACGVKVPMLSGRALGHTGGTLDKLESIPDFNVFLEVEEFKNVLDKCGMVICGQTENIVPADKKFYALRDSTATVNSIPLITSSIMSKKLALGTDAIVLDVKTGSGAFLPALNDGIALCRSMVEIGEKNNRKSIGLITNMDQPLGNAVGNSLEIIESIECLKGNGPDDLMEVTLALGACMLSAAGIENDIKRGVEKLKEVIRSGEAMDIFKKFTGLQNGDEAVCEDYSLFGKSKYSSGLTAERDGFIESIDAYETGMAAIDIGAGRRTKEDSINHTSGFIFNKKVGDKVKKGDIIVIIHSDSEENSGIAKERLSKAIKIVAGKILKPKMIYYIADRSGLKEWEHIIDPSI